MNAFPIDLDQLLTVVAGVLDDDGALVAANAGFLRLLPTSCVNPIGARIAEFFVQPTFAAVVAAVKQDRSDGYRGLMTIGDRAGKTRTLRGRAWESESRIRVLAEYDMDDLERLNDAIADRQRGSAVARHALARANVTLRRRGDRIEQALFTDPLTGVGNRRRLDQGLAMGSGRVRDFGGTLSAIMVDLDHFKSVNDRYGHAAGDKVLVRVGGLLGSHTRSGDTVARFGGEEFVVLMPGASLECAAAKAEALRNALEAVLIEPMTRRLTASFGVAELERNEGGESFLSRTDAALYQAKGAGRNRVVMAHAGAAISIRA